MNAVKDLLRSGGTAVGATGSVTSDIAFLADSGFDFILFDTEHSPIEIKALQPQLQAMAGKKAAPIVRVGENRQDMICYALDIGAKGIVVPMVNTREEALDMVKWCKYPFEGARSSSGVRGDWGEYKSYREYMDAVNQQMLVIPMIETVESMDNLEAILSVPGIDVLLVGPSDLSINLDVTQEYSHPKYVAALDRIAAACANAGVVAGMYFIPPGMDPNQFVQQGFRFFTVPWARWATDGVQGGLATITR